MKVPLASITIKWMVVFTSGLTPIQSKMGCQCFFFNSALTASHSLNAGEVFDFNG